MSHCGLYCDGDLRILRSRWFCIVHNRDVRAAEMMKKQHPRHIRVKREDGLV